MKGGPVAEIEEYERIQAIPDADLLKHAAWHSDPIVNRIGERLEELLDSTNDASAKPMNGEKSVDADAADAVRYRWLKSINSSVLFSIAWTNLAACQHESGDIDELIDIAIGAPEQQRYPARSHEPN